jgi:hypothetical protein
MPGSFFGIQLALDLPVGHRLRNELAELVCVSRAATTMIAQRTCWTRAAMLMASTLPSARLGTWDLIRDRAEAEYEEWASGLEAMAQWPATDFGDDGQLLLLTLIMLVDHGSNAARTLGDACDIPEPDWHRRGTYRRLVAVPPTLNLTGVLGSGLYLAPRPDQPGFSHDVLTGEGFEYLDAVQG